jgi:hypothetical protein
MYLGRFQVTSNSNTAGAQGGSVARALLSEPRKYRARVITRSPTKEKALQLADLGAEVIQADYRDRRQSGGPLKVLMVFLR